MIIPIAGEQTPVPSCAGYTVKIREDTWQCMTQKQYDSYRAERADIKHDGLILAAIILVFIAVVSGVGFTIYRVSRKWDRF